nr:alpha/beta hydrolase [Chloroflexaceae bacterium]
CAEDAPFYPTDGTAAVANTYAGDFYLRQFGAVCAGWPRGEITADFRQPIQSDVPTLLLSGENDPVTPPAYAERVAAGLPNSMHIVAPGQSHNVLYRGCLPRLLDDFLTSGSSSGLDSSCVQNLRPAPFFTSFTGPQP